MDYNAILASQCDHHQEVNKAVKLVSSMETEQMHVIWTDTRNVFDLVTKVRESMEAKGF